MAKKEETPSNKEQRSFKDLLAALETSNKTLDRIEKSSKAIVKKLEKTEVETSAEKGVPSIQGKSAQIDEIKVLKVEAEIVNTPELKVPDIKAEIADIPTLQAKVVDTPELKVPEITVPKLEVPKIEVPKVNVTSDIKAPEIKVPNLEVPKLSVPEIKVPKIEVPTVNVTSDIKAPKITVPEITVPKIEVSAKVDVPKITAPEIKVPRIEVPKIEVTSDIKAPKIDVPEIKAPKLSVPEIKVPEITVPKIDVTSDIKAPEIKVPEITVTSKIETPKLDALKVEVPELKAPKITIPEIKVPKIKVEVPEIKVPKIEVPEIKVPLLDVTSNIQTPEIKVLNATEKVDKKEPKTKADDNVYLKCCESILAGVNTIAQESSFSGGLLKQIYIQLQSIEALVEVAANGIADELRNLPKKIKLPTVSKVEGVKPSLGQKFEEEDVVTGKVKGLDPQTILDNAGLTGAIVSFGADIAKEFITLGKTLGKLSMKAGSYLVDFVKSIDFSGVTKKIKQWSEGFMKTAAGKALQSMGKYISVAFNKALDFGKKIGDSISGVLDRIGKSKAFQALKKAFVSITDYISGIAERLAPGVKALASKTYEKLAPQFVKKGVTVAKAGMMKVLGKSESLAEKIKPVLRTKGEKVKRAARAKDVDVGPLGKLKKVTAGLTDKLGKGLSRFLQFIADGIAKFGDNKVVKGALTLGILAAGLFAAAKALVALNDVNWSSFVKAGIALAGLVGTAILISKNTKDILKSSLAIGVLATSLWVTAKALQEFASVKWPDILTAGAVLLGLVGIVSLISKKSKDALKGALAIGAMAVSLWITGKALKEFATVEWGSIFKAGLVLIGFAALITGLGKVSKDILKGALAIGAMSISLWVTAKALQEFASVEWSSIFKAGLVLLGFGVLIAGIGKVAGQILMGALAVVALGAALWVAAKGLNAFSEVDWKTLLKAGVALVAFGALAAGIGLIAGPILLGSLAIAALGGAMWIAGKGFASFAKQDWASIAKGVLALAAFGVVAAVFGLALPLIVAGSIAIGVLSIAIAAFGLALQGVGSGFEQFARGMQALSALKGEELMGIAKGIGALGVAMAAFGAGQAAAGLGNLVSRFLTLGTDSPVDQLLKIGAAGDGIMKAATGMEKLAAAMAKFADVSPASLKALNDFPWLRATAFAAAGGTMTVGPNGATVGAVSKQPSLADQKSNAALVTPQDSVQTGNLTGATIDYIQKDTSQAMAAGAAPAVIPVGGGGGTSVVNNSNVNAVTYNNNNIPDRTMNYLTPAFGF